MVRSLLVANWKMYKTVAESQTFVQEWLKRRAKTSPALELVICPTLPALYTLAQALRGTDIAVGAQTLDLGREGANTGAVSGYLLREAGASYVIVGHSERRRLYGENNAVVRDQTVSALEYGLKPIICVGESRAEREDGRTDAVILHQVQSVIQALNDLGDTVFAYEPVWAIGTGLVPTAEEANRVAGVIRDALVQAYPNSGQTVRILYGGSVNRQTVREFATAPQLDGALVGGASLDVEQWIGLNQAWMEVRG